MGNRVNPAGCVVLLSVLLSVTLLPAEGSAGRLASSGYEPRWDNSTPFSDIAASWSAPNRAQRFRCYFVEGGLPSRCSRIVFVAPGAESHRGMPIFARTSMVPF